MAGPEVDSNLQNKGLVYQNKQNSRIGLFFRRLSLVLYI